MRVAKVKPKKCVIEGELVSRPHREDSKWCKRQCLGLGRTVLETMGRAMASLGEERTKPSCGSPKSERGSTSRRDGGCSLRCAPERTCDSATDPSTSTR